MGCLLDGLHEDMNRIMKKPFVEKIESKGRPDDLVSREAWRRFLLRNDSEIVDRCFGQLKSHVTCRNCGFESITFDEFNSLALPVPVKNTKRIPVLVFPLPIGSPPVSISVDIEATGSVGDLKKCVLESMSEIFRGSSSETYDSAQSHSKLTKSHEDIALEDTYDVIDGAECDVITEDPVIVSHPMDSISTDDPPPPPYSESNGSGLYTENEDPPPPYSRLAAQGPVYLQVCICVSHSKKLDNLNDETSVQEILKHLNFNDIVIYQLEKDASIVDYSLQKNTTYNQSSSYDHDSYGSGSKANVLTTAITVSIKYVDASMVRMKKSYYSGISTASVIGIPNRFAFELGVTTMKDIYSTIEAVALSHLPVDSVYKNFSRIGGIQADGAKVPFRVFCVNIWGDILDEIDYNSREPLIHPFTKSSLLCVWTDDALIPETAVVSSMNTRYKLNSVTKRPDSPYVIEYDTYGYPKTSNVINHNETGAEKGKVDITACLNKFIERETLPEEETWYCPSCKVHKSPIKKFDLWAVPDILIVQLKRFQYIPGTYFVHREKIENLVEFPVEGFDLSQYVMGSVPDGAPPIFDLYGVSEHSGGLGGGHYTAVCKTPGTNDWYSYNDSFVSKVSAESAVTSKAYVLFYKRRGASLKWAGINPLDTGLENSNND